jgi:hypothetical protein
MRVPVTDHYQYQLEAATQFDHACRLMPRSTNQQIAEALSQAIGISISRRAVSDWRTGQTEIRAAYLLAAFELAGINQTLALSSPTMRSTPVRKVVNGPRLRVLGGGLGLAAALLFTLQPAPLKPYIDGANSYLQHLAQPAQPVGYAPVVTSSSSAKVAAQPAAQAHTAAQVTSNQHPATPGAATASATAPAAPAGSAPAPAAALPAQAPAAQAGVAASLPGTGTAVSADVAPPATTPAPLAPSPSANAQVSAQLPVAGANVSASLP